jgi:hypothetical protein
VGKEGGGVDGCEKRTNTKKQLRRGWKRVRAILCNLNKKRKKKRARTSFQPVRASHESSLQIHRSN